MAAMNTTTLNINGAEHTIETLNDPDEMPLLWALRDNLGTHRNQIRLRGGAVRRLHRACGRRGRARLRHADRGGRGARITTIEGLDGPSGSRRCRRPGATSTWRSAAIASPARSCRPRRCWRCSRSPTDADIDLAMDGNVCRCATYVRIRAGSTAPPKP